MAYTGTYHDDSDADDEYSLKSPAMPGDFEASPIDADVPSAEHTPTTFTYAGSHSSPTGSITHWTAGQCADFVISLGIGQYADAFVGQFILPARSPPLWRLRRGVRSCGLLTSSACL